MLQTNYYIFDSKNRIIERLKPLDMNTFKIQGYSYLMTMAFVVFAFAKANSQSSPSTAQVKGYTINKDFDRVQLFETINQLKNNHDLEVRIESYSRSAGTLKKLGLAIRSSDSDWQQVSSGAVEGIDPVCITVQGKSLQELALCDDEVVRTAKSEISNDSSTVVVPTASVATIEKEAAIASQQTQALAKNNLENSVALSQKTAPAAATTVADSIEGKIPIKKTNVALKKTIGTGKENTEQSIATSAAPAAQEVIDTRDALVQEEQVERPNTTKKTQEADKPKSGESTVALTTSNAIELPVETTETITKSVETVTAPQPEQKTEQAIVTSVATTTQDVIDPKETLVQEEQVESLNTTKKTQDAEKPKSVESTVASTASNAIELPVETTETITKSVETVTAAPQPVQTAPAASSQAVPSTTLKENASMQKRDNTPASNQTSTRLLKEVGQNTPTNPEESLVDRIKSDIRENRAVFKEQKSANKEELKRLQIELNKSQRERNTLRYNNDIAKARRDSLQEQQERLQQQLELQRQQLEAVRRQQEINQQIIAQQEEVIEDQGLKAETASSLKAYRTALLGLGEEDELKARGYLTFAFEQCTFKAYDGYSIVYDSLGKFLFTINEELGETPMSGVLRIKGDQFDYTYTGNLLYVKDTDGNLVNENGDLLTTVNRK